KHAYHFLKRRGDDGAAGFAAVEECVLVDLLRLVRMPDEDHLDVTVAAAQKEIEQRVEPLGEILQVLVHRAGNVHEAEHDGLRYGLRHGLVPPVAYIDGIDERNGASAQALPLELGAKAKDLVLIRPCIL